MVVVGPPSVNITEITTTSFYPAKDMMAMMIEELEVSCFIGPDMILVIVTALL